MWTIPLFDLNYDHREEEAVIEVLRSKWLTSGPKTAEFGSIVFFKHPSVYSVRDMFRLVEEGSERSFAALCTKVTRLCCRSPAIQRF